MKKKKHYIIYKITNLINGKIYIGQHITFDINDDYMGSSSYLANSIKKHGIENFKKEILFDFKDKDELNKKEAELVNEEFVKRDDTYNINLGGSSWYYVNKSGKAESIAHWKIAHNNFLKLLNNKEYKEQYSKKVSNGLKKAYKDPNKFIKHKSGYFKGEKAAFYGKKHTEETKLKMSQTHKLKLTGVGEKNSNYGKVWVYNLELKINKSIKKEELDFYLSQGWLKGRKMKW